jgi:hypothetical protein
VGRRTEAGTDRRGRDRRDPDPREAGRPGARAAAEVRRPASPADGRRSASSATEHPAGPGVRGWLAVLGMFLLTLAAAGADSFLGPGLGTITLLALTAVTVVAGLTVRRRDLLSVLIAPPLVFVAVAVLDITLAPSATLNLASLATLLVRGFPAMGIATAAALLVWLFRLVTKR